MRWGLGLTVATAIAAFATASTTLAADSSDPWQDAAARVSFPVYKPTVTLGFRLARVDVDVQTDCFAGSQWSVSPTRRAAESSRRNSD